MKGESPTRPCGLPGRRRWTSPRRVARRSRAQRRPQCLRTSPAPTLLVAWRLVPPLQLAFADELLGLTGLDARGEREAVCARPDDHGELAAHYCVREGDCVRDAAHGGDGACCQRGAVHDSSVQRDFAVLVEHRSTPASNAPLFSSDEIAATTASTLEPACSSTRRPAARASSQPILCASTWSSGMSYAPPCTARATLNCSPSTFSMACERALSAAVALAIELTVTSRPPVRPLGRQMRITSAASPRPTSSSPGRSGP